MKRPLDSRQLYAFYILAQTGSFTHAAKKLFLSQSAVSHSMRSLEQDVGCRLLDRMHKKVVLTQAGEQLLHHTEKIVHEMSAARTSLEELGKWGKGRLRLGATSMACQYILPAVLRQFKDSFPDCQITIDPADTEKVLELLSEHRIDIAVALQPEHEASIEFIPLFTDELVFLVAPTHAWAISGHVDRSQIPKQSYVLYKKSSYTFRLIEDYFKDEEMVLNTTIELGSIEPIKELVKLGLGVGILAPWVANNDLAEGSLVALPLGRRKLKRHWGILHWKGRRLSLAEERFISLCQNLAAEFQTRGVQFSRQSGATPHSYKEGI
jgi:LysR family transcriptional regulator, low CO2-responsive transcriptional regulator